MDQLKRMVSDLKGYCSKYADNISIYYNNNYNRNIYSSSIYNTVSINYNIIFNSIYNTLNINNN
uniref:Uncharacterized protein n=1 Tax=Magallana gigas TaxID=29159 RepID=K1QZS1_MAGGI